MDKQNSDTNNKKTNTALPKVSIFSKPNFYKSNRNLKSNIESLTPKFDKSSLPKANVVVTQHKGGS